MEQHQGRLEREKESNKETRSAIVVEERGLVVTREKLQKADQETKDTEGRVAIKRNQLSAFATELQNKRADVANVNQVLGERMERLEAAKKKYQATKDRLNKEIAAQDRLESANKASESEYKESENMKTEVEKEIRSQKETLFKES